MLFLPTPSALCPLCNFAHTTHRMAREHGRRDSVPPRKVLRIVSSDATGVRIDDVERLLNVSEETTSQEVDRFPHGVDDPFILSVSD